jgi:hypothetical protein
MKPVKSSTIEAVDHDGKQMTVRFKSDRGESIGKFFHANVKKAGFAAIKRET